jgi:hypothetical protein
MRRLRMAGVSLLTAAVLAAPASTMQPGTALSVSIGGAQVPAYTQPRVVIEQQRNAADQARIRVAGPLGVSYARTVTPGDAVAVVARTIDGSSMTVFEGRVTSLEEGVVSEPSVVVHALGAVRGEEPSGAAVSLGHAVVADARLVDFAARLSARASVQTVLITGVLESTGEPLVGRAAAPAIPLGADRDAWSGATITVDTDRRFASVDEANAFALTVLTDVLATRISGEALTDGIPGIEIGSLVDVRGAGTPFDGKYHVTGVKHQLGGESYGGFSTSLRLRRADLGMFHHPAIDDEVLVAFEAGDTLRPSQVASLWDCEASGRADPSDDRRCRFIRWPW